MLCRSRLCNTGLHAGLAYSHGLICCSTAALPNERLVTSLCSKKSAFLKHVYLHSVCAYCLERGVPKRAFFKNGPTLVISAATYRGAKCTTLKTAEKQPTGVPSGSWQTPKKSQNSCFSGVPAFFRLFYREPLGTPFGCFSAVSMSCIWHLCRWPQRLQALAPSSQKGANPHLAREPVYKPRGRCGFVCFFLEKFFTDSWSFFTYS